MSPSLADRRVVVVGAGVSGLTTALALSDLCAASSVEVPAITLLESEARVGGKVRTSLDEGFLCEWGVNGFLNKEPRTLELVQRLDLAGALCPASGAFNKRYIFTRGKLRQVHMHPLKFLFSRLLPFRAKLRLLREPWIKPAPPTDHDESVAEFARRRVGPVAHQILVDPMQTGIFAGDPEQMSVAACFPRVVEVEREYGSLIRGMAKLAKERKAKGEPLPGAGPAGHLTSFRGGMQVLTDHLAERLGAETVRLGQRVTGVARREGGGYRVAVAGEAAALEADALVLACPAHATASIAAELDPELAAACAEIPYPPMAVVCLGYRREAVAHPLDGFGFLVPRSAGLRMLGALWASATFPDNAPSGRVLIRVMLGGARDLKILDLDDEALVRVTAEEVARVHGCDGPPAFARVYRHELAIPQYLVGHPGRLERIERRLSALPGLHLTGNAYRGIGVNDCARNAWPVAEAVLAGLGHS
jgi:oxygen-dependent protoporphyrinogen oxidase